MFHPGAHNVWRGDPGSNTWMFHSGAVWGEERDPNDPIATPDGTFTVFDRLTRGGVSGVRFLAYRDRTGNLYAEVDPTLAGEFTQAIGYFGDTGDKSDYTIVVIGDGYEVARYGYTQTLTGEPLSIPLERHDLVYESGAAGTGVSTNPTTKVLTVASANTVRELYSYLWDQAESGDGAAGGLTAAEFPLWPRESGRLALFNGWSLAAGSLDNLSGAGVEILNASLVATASYANIAMVSAPGGSGTAYYSQNGGAATSFNGSGQIDELVDVTTATTSLRVLYRVYGRTYDEVNVNTVSGDTTLEAKRYPIAISTAIDAKIEDDDATVSTTAPYTGMTYTKHDPAVSKTLGGTTDTFDRVVDANGGTLEEAHTFIQYTLRQAANKLDALAGTFVGDTYVGEQGLFIENIGSGADRVQFLGLGGNTLTQPSLQTVTVTFSANLVGGTWILVTDASYPGAGAVHVTDSNGSQVDAGGAGNIASSSLSFTYDHDANGDLAVVAVAINKGSGRWVEASGTITSSGLSLSLSADDETSEAYPSGGGAGSTIDGAAGTITPPGTFTAGDYGAIYRDGVDWQHDDGGLIYGQMWRVSGGDDLGGGTTTDVDFFLQSGWSVVIGHSIAFTDGATNLRREGGSGSPFTAGSGVVLALAPSSRRGLVQEVEGLSGTTAAKVLELHRAQGLEAGVPRVITDSQDSAGTITRTITDDGTTTTVTRS